MHSSKSEKIDITRENEIDMALQWDAASEKHNR